MLAAYLLTSRILPGTRKRGVLISRELECDMWDPAQYVRFAGERSRPFHELMARVGAGDPKRVADLGCGPGELTAVLAARWPDAQVTGRTARRK
jgi:cyclopropane fatty-acyl-phospholipid synthase-like methyltransferase